MSWIANAEAGSSVRAKLNSLMIPISSVTISSPVEYIDIALPSGYSDFRLTGSDIWLTDQTFAGRDFIAGAVSTDAGATFFCDSSNTDTYRNRELIMTTTAGDPAYNVFDDSLAYITVGNGNIFDFELWIVPGSAARGPRLRAFAAIELLNGPSLAGGFEIVALNPAATTPPVYARVNLLRLLPYGHGDCDPPTSDETFASGHLALFGTPST